ncbi:hypothetical protein ACK4AA_21360, partial [Aeromonas veronii]
MKWAPKEKRKQALDFRSGEGIIRHLSATSATLFNNLNQAICVGTHSIEHQTIFDFQCLVKWPRRFLSNKKSNSLFQQFIEPLFEAT